MKFQPLERAAAVLHLAHMPGNPKWDTTDGMASIAEVIGGGVPFMVTDDDGAALAVIVLDTERYANGTELVVRVGHQLSNRGNLTEVLIPEIVRLFGAGCVSVMVRTRRAGLVKKLEKAGFKESAKIMRKAIHDFQ